MAGAFLGKPLKDLADAARIYGELLGGVDKLWQASDRRRPRPPSSRRPTALADANLEALRQVSLRPDAPAEPGAQRRSANLALLPDRPAQEKRNKLLKAIEDWRASGPAAPPRAMVLEDLPRRSSRASFVRGNPNNLGDDGAAAVPARAVATASRAASRTAAAGLELARAIVDRDNPLTARVLVNRVWLHHFGTALVRTPSDFGLRSEPPTHPELLDYLAATFMEQGWSLKQLHRQIVLSAVYQQASDDRAECRQSIRRTPAVEDEPPPARFRGHARRAAGRRRPARHRRSAARRSRTSPTRPPRGARSTASSTG